MNTNWQHKAFGIVLALGLVGMALYGLGYWAWGVFAQ